jgi:hypothetical protein
MSFSTFKCFETKFSSGVYACNGAEQISEKMRFIPKFQCKMGTTRKMLLSLQLRQEKG